MQANAQSAVMFVGRDCAFYWYHPVPQSQPHGDSTSVESKWMTMHKTRLNSPGPRPSMKSARCPSGTRIPGARLKHALHDRSAGVDCNKLKFLFNTWYTADSTHSHQIQMCPIGWGECIVQYCALRLQIDGSVGF